MTKLGYNVNQEEDVKDFKSGFEVIEPGWKKMVITESSIQDNSNKDGKLLVFTYETQDGKAQTMPDRLNIVNKSEVAQKIARACLAKIALAIGHKGKLEDTDVLHGRPLMVKVSIEDFKSNKKGADGQYKTLQSNKAVDYKAVGEVSETAEQTESKESVGW